VKILALHAHTLRCKLCHIGLGTRFNLACQIKPACCIGSDQHQDDDGNRNRALPGFFGFNTSMRH